MKLNLVRHSCMLAAGKSEVYLGCESSEAAWTFCTEKCLHD